MNSRMNPYLFVPDVKRFRRRIRGLEGTAARLWKSIQAPSEGGRLYSPALYNSAFAYLATGRESYARTALAEIQRTMEFYRAGEISIDVHFHTWCNSAPMARAAIMLDWIADASCVTESAFSEIREQMLDYTFKHPYSIAKSRLRTFDNQISSMAFCCATVGYLFGVKRGRDLRAQRMLDAGLMRFPDIFGLTPRGGYSYEGSTYFCQIVAPVVTWFCALAEEITGEDYFQRAFPPTGCSPAEILQTYRKIISPSGLMPP